MTNEGCEIYECGKEFLICFITIEWGIIFIFKKLSPGVASRIKDDQLYFEYYVFIYFPLHSVYFMLITLTNLFNINSVLFMHY